MPSAKTRYRPMRGCQQMPSSATTTRKTTAARKFNWSTSTAAISETSTARTPKSRKRSRWPLPYQLVDKVSATSVDAPSIGRRRTSCATLKLDVPREEVVHGGEQQAEHDHASENALAPAAGG